MLELSEGVLIAWDGSELHFVDALRGGGVSCSWPADSLPFRCLPEGGVSTILDALDSESAAGLASRLNDKGLVTENCVLLPTRAETVPGWHMSTLADALLAGLPAIPSGESLLIHTADGWLALPDSQRPAWQASLDLFTGGLTPLPRLRGYAYMLSSKERCVIGDALPASLRSAAMRAAAAGDLHAVDIRTQRRSELSDAPGRLHPAQEIRLTARSITPGVSLHRATARLATPNIALVRSLRERWAWGAALNNAQNAASKALSEAVERYAAATVPVVDLTYAAAKELPGAYLDPRTIAAYSEAQLNRHPDLRGFNPGEPRWWIPGQHLDGSVLFVLVDCVYYPFRPPAGNDGRVHLRANSSGMACHRNRDSARRAAALELIERDALLHLWHSGNPGVGVLLESLPEDSQHLTRVLGTEGWSTTILTAESHGTTTAVAVARGDDGVCLGAAAGTPGSAIHRALLEATAALGLAPRGEPLTPAQVSLPRDHRELYRFPPFRDETRFLTRPATWRSFGDLPTHASWQPPRAAVFIEMATPAEWRRSVVRCLIPGLLGLHFGADREPEGTLAHYGYPRPGRWAHGPLPVPLA
ncbi:MAG: YcaO-like family protein [Actinomycetota bacterium]|nr:YcaO-like family protein [Actinomycetota bacterium]